MIAVLFWKTKIGWIRGNMALHEVHLEKTNLLVREWAGVRVHCVQHSVGTHLWCVHRWTQKIQPY